MKKYVKKGLSLILVASMMVCSLAGCGDNTNEKDNTPKEDKNADSVSKVETLLNDKISGSDDAEKKETVYVEMDSEGNVTKTTVSDSIKVNGNEKIKDYSKLDNIKNIGGDEKFTKTDNGEIVWENKGEDISYQGTTTEKTPINVKVTYYLDDKKISAKDLAGKSGKVKIVYDYENNGVDSSGKFIPFIVLTGMVLDDNFTNVSVDNGKVVNYENTNIVIGYGAPGFKEHLLNSVKNAKDYLKDIDIPESMTVTADVKEFSMNMTLSVASSEIGDMDLEKILDFSDIEEQMDELQKGTDSLVNGSKELNEGAVKLKNGGEQVNYGAKSLYDYTVQLSTGTGELITKYTLFDKSIKEGINEAKSGADKLYTGAKDLDNYMANLKTGAKELDDGVTKANAGSKKISAGLKSVKGYFEDSDTEKGLVSGAKELATGTKAADDGVNQLVETLKATPDSIEKNIDEIIKTVKTKSAGQIDTVGKLNRTVEGINDAVEQGTELQTVLSANHLDATTYYSLVQAYYSVQTLQQVKAQFENQIEASSDDIKSLTAGMSELKKGSATLSNGISGIYDGIKSLTEGAEDLDEGMDNLKIGTSSVKEGTEKLKKGTEELNAGAESLSKGAGTLSDKVGAASTKIKSGIGTIDTAASKISEGAKTLFEGTNELQEGIVSLASGSKELRDGTIKLNNEGIKKITDLFKNDVPEVIEKVQDILNSGKEYNTFSGKDKNMSGSVKFIFKVSEISTEK